MKRLAYVLVLMLISSCSLMDFKYSTQYYSVYEEAPDNCLLESNQMYVINGETKLQYICKED